MPTECRWRGVAARLPSDASLFVNGFVVGVGARWSGPST
jgi:hypothetical protein